MLEPAFTGVFPALHMELVKVPVPSTRNLGAESRLREGVQSHIQQEDLLLWGWGWGVLSGYKNIELGSAQNAL